MLKVVLLCRAFSGVNGLFTRRLDFPKLSAINIWGKTNGVMKEVWLMQVSQDG